MKAATSARISASLASRSGPSGRSAHSCCDAHLDIAAELNVGAAAGHVGRDRDRARHAGFGDDIGFLFVEARVEHGEELRRLAGARGGVELLQRLRLGEVDLPVALRDEIIGELFGLFDRGRADEHRLHFRVGRLDLA